MTPGGSFYIYPSSGSSTEISFDDISGTYQEQSKPIEALNEYLRSRDFSPVRSTLHTPWESASERTKRYYIRKAEQGVTAVVQDIAPNDAAPLFQEICFSKAICHTLSGEEDSADKTSFEETLMEALAECYSAADCWEPRRQILSVMAEKVSFKRLQHWIPDLTKHRFTEAKRHCLVHGRGAP